MKQITINLPKLGESIMSATIVQWFKNVGETVALDEPLLEVATDKVNSEIPSPVEGVVKEILAQVDDELDVGAPLAIIETGGKVNEDTKVQVTSTCAKKQQTDQSMKGFYSPAVLRMAGEQGIGLDELAQIPASGTGGRLTKSDIEHYISHRAEAPAGSSKISGMRKVIADNMMKSHSQIPSATLITEVDVTDVMAYISSNKQAFLEKHSVKLSVTSFIARAIGLAAKEFPAFNASLVGDNVTYKEDVNLGIAVNVDEGLVVPVIKQCGKHTLVEIAKAIADLGARARTNSLKPDDVMDGTITMTNFGMGGTLIGIPIIRYPETAIIGVGAIERKVVALDDETTAIRKCVYLSVTFDHRLIDGMDGCAFLETLKKHLEVPDALLR